MSAAFNFGIFLSYTFQHNQKLLGVLLFLLSDRVSTVTFSFILFLWYYNFLLYLSCFILVIFYDRSPSLIELACSVNSVSTLLIFNVSKSDIGTTMPWMSEHSHDVYEFLLFPVTLSFTINLHPNCSSLCGLFSLPQSYQVSAWLQVFKPAVSSVWCFFCHFLQVTEGTSSVLYSELYFQGCLPETFCLGWCLHRRYMGYFFFFLLSLLHWFLLQCIYVISFLCFLLCVYYICIARNKYFRGD